MKDYPYILGIDEVGRGPLAGPVTVAVCSVAKENTKSVQQRLVGITDSKKLSAKKREYYFAEIKKLKKEGLLDYALTHVSAQVIDTKGIQYALKTALVRALGKLKVETHESFVYLDGGLSAPKDYAQETVIKGDQKIFHIAVASVIGKVLRDMKMNGYAKKYPEYAFEKHKGYGTQEHRNRIKEHGICDIHRSSWIKA